ncbi:MAG: CBS domain-containing protein [Robiginitomaculum sp.]|nr:CBS domain-containing protein [Robiginitomaculum sp.]
MSVANFLKTKGNSVYSVREDASLREAILLLNTKNIGVVLVTTPDNMLTGILSERDIIRRALVQETGFRDESVSKTMTKKVKSVTRSASIDDVMTLMTNSRFRHVPIVEDGKIYGLISIGDVVKIKIAEAENEAAALREYIATG